MGKQHKTKLVRHGMYVAEVEVELVYMDDGWEPYLTVDDAERLDEVRQALRRGDLEEASRHGQIYILTPVTSLTGSPRPRHALKQSHVIPAIPCVAVSRPIACHFCLWESIALREQTALSIILMRFS